MNTFSILLVDDIEQNLHSLELIIKDSFDVNILTALSAQEGMGILMKEEVNLILTDVQMPDIDGFEFAEYLNGIQRTKDIPLIFITGIYDKDEYQKKGYNLGAIEYITKPIDDVILNAKLKIYIDLFEKSIKKDEEIEVKNKVLIHQAKMVSMGEMIGIIAHQLKQPLNVLSLYCDDVKDSHKFGEIDDAFVEDFSLNTKSQIKFLSDTVDGFRNFFNPDKSKRVFLLQECIDKTISLVEKQFITSNIQINQNINEESIYGVITELEQVILNLIVNAKDMFILRSINNAIINISASSNDTHTIIHIEDNAGGTQSNNIDKLFDPYYTTKKEGTGTGLYMVKLIIKTSFEGDLEVENSSEGMKFILTLPKKELNL